RTGGGPRTRTPLTYTTLFRSCAREMEAALDELEDAGMKRLVLDLRGNGGGDLHETVKILGLFLPPETVVVTTRGRNEERAEVLKDRKSTRLNSSHVRTPDAVF